MANEDKARLFEEMAERIRRQPEGEFAGAVLIVPPGDDEGAGLDFLAVESRPNAVNFWNATKSRLDVAHAEMMGRERVGDPFGRR